MDSTEHRPSRPRLSTVCLWISLFVVFYVFSTGPVTRWFPDVGEVLYAPLSPVADSKFFGPLLRRWITLWGVDTGE